MRKNFVIQFLVLSAFNCTLFGQIITQKVRDRADNILKQMTLEEKIAYIGGQSITYPGIMPVPRLNLPHIRMADGPQGLRSYGVNKSTLYPAGILAAATWNRSLAEEFGKSLGRDSRARGIHVLLGPGVNIYRSPLCGRNFEYFGEDPYLAGETAVSYINGVQSQQVIATIKHMAANNQEWDRRNVSSDMDERTLHEIYLLPFEKAVKEANVGAVMNSYNLLNGIHTSEHPYLNIEVLRDMWKFDGILMSDWGSAISPVPTANGGLDLEMSRGRVMNATTLLPAIQEGLVTEATIDTKVRHILETIISYGFLDRDQTDSSIPLNDPKSAETALDLAREGIVLLKNENNVLPFSKNSTFLLLGPNAAKCVTGGGSGGLVTTYSCNSLLNGMKEVAGTKNITFDKLLYAQDVATCGEFFAEKGSSETGFKAEYYNNSELAGKPSIIETVPAINFTWEADQPLRGNPKNHFSARWTTVYKPVNNALVVFRLNTTHGFRMFIDDREVMNNWTTLNRNYEASLRVEAGKEYNIRIEHFNRSLEATAKLTYEKVDLENETWLKSLQNAENILLSIGFDSFTEKENQDRSFEIPVWQEELINIIAPYNKNVIAIVNAGGGVNFSSWSDKVQGILLVWYNGQEGGKAIAEIVTGAISPSGRLPVSVEKRWEDNPVFNSYYADKDDPERVTYKEGVFVGYRGYDKSGITPYYPFGYGLTYSSFSYTNFTVEKTDTLDYLISFDVSNTGGYDAAEVPQLYVGFQGNDKPRKELKGYDKVFLKKGETKRISISLDERSFTSYDAAQHKFVVNQGLIEIMVGKSSRDIVWKYVVNNVTKVAANAVPDNDDFFLSMNINSEN